MRECFLTHCTRLSYFVIQTKDSIKERKWSANPIHEITHNLNKILAKQIQKYIHDIIYQERLVLWVFPIIIMIE